MKALIMDDELYCTQAIQVLMAKHCKPAIETIAFTDTDLALEYLQSNHVDILFLDIEMPGMNGFEFLERLYPFRGSVIFTTAYDHYALKAIKVDAVDYLLKPIDTKELLHAIEKVSRLQKKPDPDTLRDLLQHIDRQSFKPISKIALPTFEGTYMVQANEIIRCESDGSYSTIFIEGAKPLVVSKNLRELEVLINNPDFFRLHKSHLINLAHIKFISKQDGGDVLMSDGSSVPISRSIKQEFLQRIKS